jgi:L-lactate dehydrogenase complex protein LldF
VYKEVGGHVYDATYPGPIGIILTSFLGRQPKNLAGASTLCGACLEVCPVKIDIPRMLLTLRHEAEHERRVPWGERWAFKALGVVLGSPTLYRLSSRLARLVQRVFMRDGHITWLPRPLAGWTRFRDLPPVSARPFHLRWKALNREP